MFKSRFFPSGSILEDNVKTNGSYAWKSILQAQSVVKLGSRWRIGNGSSIRIWGDNWLPRSSPGQVISPRNYFPVDAKVSSLIDPIKMEWKECMINHVFLPLKANLILGISLSHHPAQDKIIWPHTPIGTFFIRSAYHFLLNNHYGDRPGPSNSSSSLGLWKKIWDLPIPPRFGTSYGEHAEKPCQRSQISDDKRSLLTQSAMNARAARRISFMWYGTAQLSNKFGTIPLFPIGLMPFVLALSQISSSRSLTQQLRNSNASSRSRPGFCGSITTKAELIMNGMRSRASL